MLTILVPGAKYLDDSTQTFIEVKPKVLHLEHSLASVALWESLWEKPFFSNNSMTVTQTLDYIKCMTLDENVDPLVYKGIKNDLVKKIEEYIKRPMTATWFSETEKPKGRKKIITAEIIYYQMATLNIPFECDKWHLNRLLTLIRVCADKNAPPKKMSKNEVFRRNRELNAANRRRAKSNG